MASSQSKTSSQSGSASEDQQMSSSTFANIDQFGGGDSNFISSNRTISAAVPCSYLPSPFDHRVPSPRNCGARFNRFGIFLNKIFYKINFIKVIWYFLGQ